MVTRLAHPRALYSTLQLWKPALISKPNSFRRKTATLSSEHRDFNPRHPICSMTNRVSLEVPISTATQPTCQLRGDKPEAVTAVTETPESDVVLTRRLHSVSHKACRKAGKYNISES